MYSKLPEHLLEFSRSLRLHQTDAESVLWLLLRNRSLGYKFRRQRPVGKYVLDFYCHEVHLAVELDGGQHNTAAVSDKDERRTAKLQELGIEVLRFWDHEVLKETEAVLERIHQVLMERVMRG